MEEKRLCLDGQVLSIGVQHACSRSEEPLLCFVKPESIRFVAVSGLRMALSWEAPLVTPVTASLVFMIPPMIANLLLCEAVRSQPALELARRGTDMLLRLDGPSGGCELHWRSDLSSFPAPPEFAELIKAPGVLIDIPYLRLSDATHQSVAKLAHLESDEKVSQSKLAILIDLDLGRLRINGEEIIVGESRQYYFDPRLVIRALEVIKDRTVRVGISPLKGGTRAYLSLSARQEGWDVQCSLLSIGTDTQKLYPLPPGKNR